MLIWCVIAVLIVGIDQLSKWLIVKNIPLGEGFTVIPNIIDFTYVKNTGAAFSILSDATWILSFISIAFCIGIAIWFFLKKPKNKLLCVCICMLFAGALGNAIDRIMLGYVVDFIETTFISFPVFNIADISITVGAVLLMIYEMFFDKEESKKTVK